jgi:dTDP-4-amino-4,6-dideoxygalactose transaminase
VKPLDIMLALEKENIESRPIWKPMHLQPVFQTCDFVKIDDTMESISGDIFDHGVCLPSDIKNTEEDMDRVISIIRNLFAI